MPIGPDAFVVMGPDQGPGMGQENSCLQLQGHAAGRGLGQLRAEDVVDPVEPVLGAQLQPGPERLRRAISQAGQVGQALAPEKIKQGWKAGLITVGVGYQSQPFHASPEEIYGSKWLLDGPGAAGVSRFAFEAFHQVGQVLEGLSLVLVNDDGLNALLFLVRKSNLFFRHEPFSLSRPNRKAGPGASPGLSSASLRESGFQTPDHPFNGRKPSTASRRTLGGFGTAGVPKMRREAVHQISQEPQSFFAIFVDEDGLDLHLFLIGKGYGFFGHRFLSFLNFGVESM